MDTRGTHLLLEYWGCDEAALASPKRVEEAMLEAAKATGATIVGRLFQQFHQAGDEAPGGVSGVVVIAESHLSIHTWPEKGYAAVDAYTCGDCNPARADKVLKKAFKARTREGLTISRGISPSGSIRIQQ